MKEPDHLPLITPLNEGAVAVTFGHSINKEIYRKVTWLRDFLLENPFPGQDSVVPAYATLTVFFDPQHAVLRQSRGQEWPTGIVVNFLRQALKTMPADEKTPEITPLIDIPVCYNGPDLSEVAAQLQITTQEVVRLHTGNTYSVFMIGFLPGFPYMGPLPEALQLPRRATPRLRVAAGSVAIAGAQTGIYPLQSPGGWHIIGHTDITLFNPTARPPSLLQPGMQVRFIAT